MLDATSIPPDWDVPVADLPPVGSSPDGLIYHPALPQPLPGGAAAGGGGPAADISGVANDASRRQREAMGGRRRWRPEVYEAIALPGLWEVVEVKNHCPFKVCPQSLRTTAAAFVCWRPVFCIVPARYTRPRR